MSLSEMLEAARAALGKRKRELGPTPAPAPAPAAPGGGTAKAELSSKAGNSSGSNNMLLAGNLAHEFLTHGTVLGRRIEATTSTAPGRRVEATWQPARAEPEPKRRYAEMSWLLMSDGAHIPGVVNPTQLGQWLQIKD